MMVIFIISAKNVTKTENQYYSIWGINMKTEYDFSNAKKNPYAKQLKKQITINVDSDAIDYFKKQSESAGIPYQTLINLYLKDCAQSGRQLKISWQ